LSKHCISRTIPILVLAALLTTASFAAAQSGNTPAVLEGVQVRIVAGHLEVLLKVTGTYTFETFDLTAPKRLVVDIKPIDKSLADPITPIDAHGVVRVRTGQFESQTSRVVFDLMDVMPANRVTSGPDGITISFWVETAGQTPPAFQEIETERRVEPARAAEIAPPVQTPPVQAAPARTETQEPVSAVNRQNLSFLEVKGGAMMLLRPETVHNTRFSLYGETATFVETYKSKLSFPLQISFGRIFALGGTPVRAGLAGQLWLLRQDGLYEATVPSPVQANALRTATLTEPLSSSLISIYVFAQFPFVSNEKIRLWFGPTVGFASGSHSVLDDFELQDQPPFGATDLKLSNPVYLKETLSGVTFGGSLTFEYIIMPALSLVLDANALYFGPNSTNLDMKMNFFQVQTLLGIQYRF
jgi:hypothetical protein